MPVLTFFEEGSNCFSRLGPSSTVLDSWGTLPRGPTGSRRMDLTDGATKGFPRHLTQKRQNIKSWGQYVYIFLFRVWLIADNLLPPGNRDPTSGSLHCGQRVKRGLGLVHVHLHFRLHSANRFGRARSVRLSPGHCRRHRVGVWRTHFPGVLDVFVGWHTGGAGFDWDGLMYAV